MGQMDVVARAWSLFPIARSRSEEMSVVNDIPMTILDSTACAANSSPAISRLDQAEEESHVQAFLLLMCGNNYLPKPNVKCHSM